MQALDSIERRLPWSFFGFMLGTISLVIAIWFFYLAKQEDATDLTFRVVEEFPLVELKERFPDIKVLYNQDNILESDKEIKIIRIRLENSGRTILQSFYDQGLPFGLSFHNSKVLAVTPVAPLEGYLHDSLFQENPPEGLVAGTLLLNKPIIEKGEQISFKVYLLQDRGIRSTEMTALGKISGLDQINVIPFDATQSAADSPGRGTSEVIAIGVASGYFGMLAFLGTSLAFHAYLHRRERRARSRLCDKFLERNDSLSDEQKRIVEGYRRGWRSYYLPTIRTLLDGGKALDISELLRTFLSRKRWWLLLDPLGAMRSLWIRRLLPLRWRPELFTVSEGRVGINEINRDFLVKFLRECHEIRWDGREHTP
jgi:hypothetical protein